MESKSREGFNQKELDEQFLNMVEDIDVKMLYISSEQEVVHVLKIIGSVTTNNLMQHFANRIPYEEALGNYTLEITLLKKVYKKWMISKSFIWGQSLLHICDKA